MINAKQLLPRQGAALHAQHEHAWLGARVLTPGTEYQQSETCSL